MSKSTRERAKTLLRRRERLRSQCPIAERMLQDRAAARAFVDMAPLARILIGMGLSPDPELGTTNLDACVAVIKDALGVAPLSEAEFEHALRLTMPPEYRETGH